MWSTVQRNDGRRTADAPVTRANPLDGRETAPQSGPDVFRPDPAPQPGMPSTQPTTTPGNPGRVNGNDSGGLNTRPNRPAPPVESTPVPPTTTTTVSGDPPPRTRVDGETVRFPARRWTGLGGCDPLIHFYADSAVNVNVKAGFKDGVPVAWWPRGLAAGEQVEFRDVRVDPNLDPVSSQSINLQKWPGLKPLGLLRDAMATPVKLGNKVEGGIAYEGLMPIAPDLTVRMAVKGIYEVRND
ncbi:MAG: hypothetical protein ACYTGX_17070, partial [Planctomycetota bacterium]